MQMDNSSFLMTAKVNSIDRHCQRTNLFLRNQRMPSPPSKLVVVLLLFTVISWQEQLPAAEKREDVAQSPRAVVARWLELHRTGKRDEASALTTGAPNHRADVLLSSKRDTGVRVTRSLGNQRVAAVVTSSRDDDRDAQEVLLFWLVRRDGEWRINKSDSFNRAVVDERLRGFLEAGDVRWHVQRDQLLGEWEAAACMPPGSDGVTACASELQFVNHNRYHLEFWGPGGSDPTYDLQGKWRIANDKIMLSHQDRTYECVVTWLRHDQLAIESADGKIRAVYERAIAAHE